jgi:hypothetical protein
VLLLPSVLAESQPNVAIQQCVKCLGALREFRERVLLQCFGEGVVEGPSVPHLELPMPWRPPFVENVGYRSVGTDPDIGGPDDQIVGNRVVDLAVFVVASPAAKLVSP